MSIEVVQKWLRDRDFVTLEQAWNTHPELVSEVERALPAWDGNLKRELAVFLKHHDGRGSGRLLLLLVADPSYDVASSAANALAKAKDLPPGEGILAALENTKAPFIRGRLYFAAANAKVSLEALRTAAQQEKDPQVLLHSQVAAVKLGGAPERQAFLERLRKANPEDRLHSDYLDFLEYIGDRRLAKGLLPWLSNKTEVKPVSHRQPHLGAFRMCDLAVWQAHTMGVEIQMEPEYMAVYSDAVIARTKAALEALPE